MGSVMSRQKILAGNWKMHNGPLEALEYFHKIAHELASHPLKPHTKRVVFPPAYALSSEIQKTARNSEIELGAQNVHWELKGAFTGELSAQALKTIGIGWVLIAHSERRQFFAETDETAARRLRTSLNEKMNVIYCIGERLEEREGGKTEIVLSRQTLAFTNILKELGVPQSTVSIAYEPVWAIGTGKTATLEQAEAAHKHIRKVVWDELGLETAQALPILYGGSVTPENAKALLSQPNIDGVLVGGASLKPDGFAKILTAI
jgi:triosephosphate isomerase